MVYWAGTGMRKQEARRLGAQVRQALASGDTAGALALLFPILDQRTPFPLLEEIGRHLALDSFSKTKRFLDRVAARKTEGGWVVIGAALREHLNGHLEAVLEAARGYIVLADVWYAPDILGERVPGAALLKAFEPALEQLRPWRKDPNPWVRRAAGVAVHYWAKRTQGKAPQQATTLLEFLSPLFEERELGALKGVGWGLKTLGRHYPQETVRWLNAQRGRRPRALMLRKAVTYLPEHLREEVGRGFGASL